MRPEGFSVDDDDDDAAGEEDDDVQVLPEESDAPDSPLREVPEEEDTLCMICCEAYAIGDHALASLKCGHVFGKSCIERWIRPNSNCPTCKAKALLRDIRIIAVGGIDLSHVLKQKEEMHASEAYVNRAKEEEAERRKERNRIGHELRLLVANHKKALARASEMTTALPLRTVSCQLIPSLTANSKFAFGPTERSVCFTNVRSATNPTGVGSVALLNPDTDDTWVHFQTHNGLVFDARSSDNFSPGRWVTCGQDEMLTVLDARSSKPAGRFSLSTTPTCCCFMPNHFYNIAVGDDMGTVRVLDHRMISSCFAWEGAPVKFYHDPRRKLPVPPNLAIDSMEPIVNAGAGMNGLLTAGSGGVNWLNLDPFLTADQQRVKEVCTEGGHRTIACNTHTQNVAIVACKEWSVLDASDVFDIGIRHSRTPMTAIQPVKLRSILGLNLDPSPLPPHPCASCNPSRKHTTLDRRIPVAMPSKYEPSADMAGFAEVPYLCTVDSHAPHEIVVYDCATGNVAQRVRVASAVKAMDSRRWSVAEHWLGAIAGDAFHLFKV